MKSLELNWIRKEDKTIPIPEVMYYPLTDMSGCYYQPSLGNEIYDLDGKPYSMNYGVIAISTKFGDDVESTIAHEWRHHWQHFNGIRFEISSTSSFKRENYNKSLIKYFTSSDTELDALRFEYKHVGIWEHWEEILYNLLIGIKSKPLITYGHNTTKNRPKIQSHSSFSRHSYSFNQTTRRIQRSI